jgi:hypothetical protein
VIGTYLAIVAALLTARVLLVDGVAAAALTIAGCVCFLGLFTLLGSLPALARKAGASLPERR